MAPKKGGCVGRVAALACGGELGPSCGELGALPKTRRALVRNLPNFDCDEDGMASTAGALATPEIDGSMIGANQVRGDVVAEARIEEMLTGRVDAGGGAAPTGGSGGWEGPPPTTSSASSEIEWAGVRCDCYRRRSCRTDGVYVTSSRGSESYCSRRGVENACSRDPVRVCDAMAGVATGPKAAVAASSWSSRVRASTVAR